jgi:hypothetical protein
MLNKERNIRPLKLTKELAEKTKTAEKTHNRKKRPFLIINEVLYCEKINCSERSMSNETGVRYN